VRLNRRSASVAAAPDWQAARAQDQEGGAHTSTPCWPASRRGDPHAARGYHAHCRRRLRMSATSPSRAAPRAVKASRWSEEVHLSTGRGRHTPSKRLGEFIVQIAGDTVASSRHAAQVAGEIRLCRLAFPDRRSGDSDARRARALRTESPGPGSAERRNPAVAETGTIVLLENEGNIRLDSVPPCTSLMGGGDPRGGPARVPDPARNAMASRWLPVSMLTGPRRPASRRPGRSHRGARQRAVALARTGRARRSCASAAARA
jgi:hypothetical protein